MTDQPDRGASPVSPRTASDHMSLGDFDEEVDEPQERLVPRGSRRWWWVAAAVLVPVVGLLAWIGVMNAKDVVTWRTIGYEVVDARTTTVDIEVERPTGWAVRCDVEALDLRFGKVGAVQVDVPASSQPLARRHVTVRTTSTAVTGQVKSCAKV